MKDLNVATAKKWSKRARFLDHEIVSGGHMKEVRPLLEEPSPGAWCECSPPKAELLSYSGSGSLNQPLALAVMSGVAWIAMAATRCVGVGR